MNRMTRHQTSRNKSNNGFRNILPLLLLVLTICSTNSLALPSRNGVLERIRGGMNVNGRGHQVHFNLPIEQQQTTPHRLRPSTSNSFFSNLFNPKNEKSKQKKREINPQSQSESDSHPLSKRSRQKNRFGSSWSSKSRNNRLIPSNSNHRQSTFLLKKDTNSNKKAATCKSNKANVASSSSSTGNSASGASSGSSSNASSSSSATSPKTTSTSSGSGSTSSQGKVGNTKSGNGMIMAGYWPEWAIGTLAPEDIDFSKFDFIDYAFVTPSSSYDLSFSDPSSSPAILKRMVKAAHAGDSKVVISIGGWGGGEYFSPAVGDASSRKTFINNIVNFYKKYNLDGIDIDWEYPNSNAAGNSKTSPQDAANFQTFLGELRTALPSGALLTAAVSFLPFIGSDGNPVASVSRAAQALDYILIMNYDVWGSSSKPGPNAPLADLCGNSTQPSASAAAGVKQWSAAGMPRNKILLGVPSYGYVSQSSASRLKSRDQSQDLMKSLKSDVPSGHPGRYDPRFSAAALESMRKSSNDKRLFSELGGNVLATTSAKSLKSSDGSTSSGQIQFNQIVAQGGLKASGNSFAQGVGWSKKWDDCSDTPFLTSGDQVITYDDTDSLYDKAAFSVLSGIAGVNMFSIDGDTKDWALTNSLIQGMADSFN